MPTAVISGFVPSTSHPPAKTPYPADTIDLVDVPYDGTRSGIATFYAGGNSVQPNGVLKIAQNGSTLILQLDPRADYSKDVYAISSDGKTSTNIQVLAKAAAGFDALTYPGDQEMAWLWANTNASWVGYYLFGAPNRGTSPWKGKRSTLASQGWKIAPIWVSYQDPNTPDQTNVPDSPEQDDTLVVSDANLALHNLFVEGFDPGSAVIPRYRDIQIKYLRAALR
jgi:hypothetical protein